MNTNELISADLLPRNVPKPSSFHENTLIPEVPEVSLMFENGFQYSNPHQMTKQSMLEKATRRTMKIVSDTIQDRGGSSSPGTSDPLEYNVHELLLKNSKLTPSKQKSKPSTPNKSSKSDKVNCLISSSGEVVVEKQNSQENNQHINSENHLIEPVESYSVWKYKNQHMFGKENVPAFEKDKNHLYSPGFLRNQSNEHGENRSKHVFEQHQMGKRSVEKQQYDQDDSPNHRMEYLKYTQGHQSPNVEYVQTRNDLCRSEDNYASRSPVGKSNWRNVSPMTEDIPRARYNQAMVYQNRSPDRNNSASELSKIVEFQNKHIEFLNEQIYNLTLQNKTVTNLSKHLKTVEDTQSEQFEFIKKNVDKIYQTILNSNKENNPPIIENCNKEKENIEDHLERVEKKLIDLINSKLSSKVHDQPKPDTHCHSETPEEDDIETSSSEDTGTKHKIVKQCKCACDTTKHQAPKFRQKEISKKTIQPMKTDHKVNTRHVEYQNVMKYNGKVPKDWEFPSKQVVSSKKPPKKIPKKQDQVEQLVMNPPASAKPVVYYQQPMYQPDKFAQNNRRLSQGGKKKDKSKSSPDEKHGVKLRKALKPKDHHPKNLGGAPYRSENTLMNDEHSLTLNARELPVINEHIPSPEASVHIDMGEYQSSSSELEETDEEDAENRDVSEESNEQEEEGAPWPTFYNNVVGKVHKLLQGNQQDIEEQAADTTDEQYRTVQVRMATIDQFKKMGISFVDYSPNSKRVTLNKTKSKLNPHHDNPLADGARRSPMTAVCNTNLSFASLQYLQRYHLLPSPNIQTQEQFHNMNNQSSD